MTRGPIQIRLRPFDRPDFGRLISWFSTPEALGQWCAAFSGLIHHWSGDTKSPSSSRTSPEPMLAPIAQTRQAARHRDLPLSHTPSAPNSQTKWLATMMQRDLRKCASPVG
jgi:hypothetical protein